MRMIDVYVELSINNLLLIQEIHRNVTTSTVIACVDRNIQIHSLPTIVVSHELNYSNYRVI